jgi:hypothetical protein
MNKLFDRDLRQLCWQVQQAAIATVLEAGSLPENIEEAAAYFANHYRLMRKHDPRLHELSDDTIALLLRDGETP